VKDSEGQDVNTEPIELIGCERVQVDATGVWYELKMSVGTLVQYTTKS
jgi:hypothetical protein